MKGRGSRTYKPGHVAALKAAVSESGCLLRPRDFVDVCGDEEKGLAAIRGLVEYGMLESDSMPYTFAMGYGDLNGRSLVYRLTDKGADTIGYRKPFTLTFPLSSAFSATVH